MKFTAETKPLLRMLEILSQTPARKPADPNIRLVARDGRVCAQKECAIGEIEGAVWRAGRCTVSSSKLLAAVKDWREASLSIEAEGELLRVAHTTLPLVHRRRACETPGRLQIFLASATGVVPSQLLPQSEFATAG